MNIHELRRAQAIFETEIEAIKERKSDLYKLRENFVTQFSRPGILKMGIDDYVLGKEKPDTGFNFCYGLERQLKGLGWMIGGNSFKFGFYFGRTKSDSTRKYRFTNRFGSSPSVALSTAKELIVDLLEKGKNQDLEGIISNDLSPMFKGKILATYYPDRYLNIFSSTHLNHFIIKLNLDVGNSLLQDEVIKREQLLAFRSSDAVMRDWPIDIYSDFLYRLFGRPTDTKPSVNDPLENYRPINFPLNAVPEFVELFLNSDFGGDTENEVAESRKVRNSRKKKRDYELEDRRHREYGERGEKLVLEIERKRLNSLGRPDLASEVDRVSLKDDSLGYDILSFESDERPRHIEVKATTRSAGSVDFFLTETELKTAMTTENFFIYMVFDILSLKPKVWPIENPFNPEHSGLNRRAIKYICSLKAKV